MNKIYKIWVFVDKDRFPGIYIREEKHTLHRVVVWNGDNWKSLSVLWQDISERKQDISDIIFNVRKSQLKDFKYSLPE